MTLRLLGRSPLAVPPLCLGGNVFGWTVDEATADPTTPTLREAARRLDLLATCVAWVSRDRARRDIIESGRAYRVGDRELLAQACEHLEARANDDVRITIDALKTRLGKTP